MPIFNLEIRSWSAPDLQYVWSYHSFFDANFKKECRFFPQPIFCEIIFHPDRPWCTWFTIFVIMSALLYCPVTCMSVHDKCEITQFNGRITCWNFYICILWDWTCLPRPSFNNKTLVPQHSNPFVAMLKQFSVLSAIKHFYGDTSFPGDWPFWAKPIYKYYGPFFLYKIVK